MMGMKYVVLKGQRYVGRHETYKEGQEFDGSELFGNEDNIEMALKGGGPNDAKPRIKAVSKPKKEESKKDRNREKEKSKDKDK